jgi:hypothetical protein
MDKEVGGEKVMEELVTLKLSTYDSLRMELSNLQDEVKELKNRPLFQTNDLGTSIYIELTEHSATTLNNMMAQFSETHDFTEVKKGHTVVYLTKKKEASSDSDD